MQFLRSYEERNKQMKRNRLFTIISGFLLTLSLFSSVYTVMADENVKVTIDGQEIMFDVPPQIINERAMVPLRAIFEALNATVEWDDETQTVTSTKDDTTIQFTIGKRKMYVNGDPINLDSPACLINDRTLVPVRAISEAFDMKVVWNSEGREVIITSFFSYGDAKHVKYNSKIYEYREAGMGNVTTGSYYNENTKELYSSFYGSDWLFCDCRIYDKDKYNNNNPYIDGSIYFIDDEKNHSIESEFVYTSIDKTYSWPTVTYNGKVFSGISAEDYIDLNLDIDSTGIWNGVRFYVGGCYGGSRRYEVRYNLNDLANYFGISRSFHYERTEDVGFIVIDEK